MAIAKKVQAFMENASWIRKMFEQGAQLKQQFGAENVFDFSLGNPNLEPPEVFYEALEREAGDRTPGVHGYMSNAGYVETREAVAEYLSEEHGVEIFSEHIIMTCGAGGGLNVALKTLLDPGEEVLVPCPYFVEYGFYIDNFGGVCRPVPTKADFSLDITAIESAISSQTKAVLINSPNNPTGRVYPRDDLNDLGRVLSAKSKELGKVLYLISDEPYSKIVYDGACVASIFQAYQNSVLVTSYSKDLSIPGERMGYIAVHPSADDIEELTGGLVFSNRTLGFVNAPALMQRVVRHLQGISVDIGQYTQKRDRLCEIMESAGYSFVRPEGAFYLFPEAPGGDDIAFVGALQDERILAVPGSGFGCPGFFRLSYCVDDPVIGGAADGFVKAAKKFGV